ncbi:hypothetical protein CSC04_5091 [Enterobacter roggenkampii]|nr:hypothetical protein CSC04_5091 [Enterobacter roggenkampii]
MGSDMFLTSQKCHRQGHRFPDAGVFSTAKRKQKSCGEKLK